MAESVGGIGEWLLKLTDAMRLLNCFMLSLVIVFGILLFVLRIEQ